MIVILTTCASDMIGDDIPSIVERVRSVVHCPVIYSTGDKAGKFRQVGAQDVLYSIVEQYVLPETEGKDIQEKTMNIQVMGIHGKAELAELCSVLRQVGIKVNRQYFLDASVPDLLELAQVELNLTLYKQLWAELLCRKRGIGEYHIIRMEELDEENAHPAGIEGFRRVVMEISSMLRLEGEAEQKLRELDRKYVDEISRLRSELSKPKIAVDSYGITLGLVLAREFGVKVKMLLYYTRQMKNFGLSDQAIEQRIDMTVKAFEKYGSNPEVLVDVNLNKVVEKIHANKIDLVITARPHVFHIHGISAISTRVISTRTRQYLLLGYESTIKAARLVLDYARARNVEYRPVLTGYPEGSTIPVLPAWWDRLVLLFGLNRASS